MLQYFLLAMCFMSLLGYFFMMLVEKKPHWFQTKKSKTMSDM